MWVNAWTALLYEICHPRSTQVNLHQENLREGEGGRSGEREKERERWRERKVILTQAGHNLLAKQESEFQDFIQHKGKTAVLYSIFESVLG